MCVLLQDGDHVVYSKFAGTDLDVGGVEHVLLKVSSLADEIGAWACAWY